MAMSLALPAEIPSSDAVPVSWQTAFWALVPLATSVMTQPSGRVCSTPAYYRTWLRSSPIFCAADTLSFLLRLIIIPIVFKMSPRHVLAWTITARYAGVEDEMEALSTLKKTSCLRWLWFILGTLGPAAKLTAAKGLPWTQAWGGMYIGSFLVFELMVVLSMLSGTPLSCRGVQSLRRALPLHEYDEGERAMNVIDGVIYVTAATAHSIVLTWAVVDLWVVRAQVNPYGDGLVPGVISDGLTRLLLLMMLVICFSFPASAAFWLISPCLSLEFSESRPIRFSIGICLSLVVVGFFWLGGIYVSVLLKYTFWDTLLLFTTFGGPWLLAKSLKWVCIRVPSIATQLGVITRPDIVIVLQEDASFTWASEWRCVFFIINIVVSVLWYY